MKWGEKLTQKWVPKAGNLSVTATVIRRTCTKGCQKRKLGKQGVVQKMMWNITNNICVKKYPQGFLASKSWVNFVRIALVKCLLHESVGRVCKVKCCKNSKHIGTCLFSGGSHTKTTPREWEWQVRGFTQVQVMKEGWYRAELKTQLWIKQKTHKAHAMSQGLYRWDATKISILCLPVFLPSISSLSLATQGGAWTTAQTAAPWDPSDRSMARSPN